MGVHPADPSHGSPSGMHAISFYCDDIQKTVGELKSKGVEFTKEIEKVADDLRSTHDSLAGPNSPVPPLASAVRRLERRAALAPALIEPAVRAIDAALTALEEARLQLQQALQVAEYDPQELEKIEERLFALRAAGRKYNAPVDELAALAHRYESDLALIDAGAERLAILAP